MRSESVLAGLIAALVIVVIAMALALSWLAVETDRCRQAGESIGLESKYTLLDGCTVDFLGFPISV